LTRDEISKFTYLPNDITGYLNLLLIYATILSPFSDMTILYALISRGKTVLAEYTSTTGNFPTVTRVLLGKIPEMDGKMSYVYDQYVFHYIVENRIIYMCMCDDMEKRRMPFGFLEEIKQRFKATYGERAQTALAFAMADDFGRILQKQMEFYNSPAADSFSQVNTKLDDVKNVMVQNIEMVLERGEKLELMVDKTDRLQQQAFKFERSSNQLKYAMYWRRVKLYLLVFFVIVLIIWILSVIICGIDYSKCK
jgi:vesicle-associated membrane protein 7